MRSGLTENRSSQRTELPDPGMISGFRSARLASTHETRVSSNGQNGAYYPEVSAGLKTVKAKSWLSPIEGWLPLVLLTIALYCVVYSVLAAHWVEHSRYLLLPPMVGIGVGFIVARMPRFPQSIMHVAACLVGHWLAVIVTSYFAYHIPWQELLVGLRAAFTGQVATETIQSSKSVFFFYLAFLSFFLGYFGCWLVYRAHLPWLVALVYCSIMFVNLYYITTVDLTYVVIIMLGVLVLLIARMQLASRIVQWTQDGLHTDDLWLRSITWRCMQVACVITLLSVLASWALPTPGQSEEGKKLWDSLGTAWTNIVDGHASLGTLGTLTTPYEPGSNFFGDQLTISGSVRLPTGEVLHYASSDGASHYLEGFTYNQFDGHNWTSIPNDESHPYDVNQSLGSEATNKGKRVATLVTIVQPPEGTKHYLFAPEQPVNFNVSTTVYNDGVTDSAWTQQSALTKNEAYTVVSNLASSNKQEFTDVPLPANNPNYWQSASYPQLKEFYLQVPDDLSPKAQQMAQQWTQGARNSYEALSMLKDHLSDTNHFKYSVENGPIPAKMDVVDWLLQNQVGFCTHYATTMAIMARLLHFPTRVVVGFTGGKYDEQRQAWVVDGNDAHSWVQSYLPGHGWVSFDPTPSASPAGAQGIVATPSAAATQAGARPTVPATATTQPAAAQATAKASRGTAHTGQQRSGSDMGQTFLLILSCALVVLAFGFFLMAFARRWWRNLYAESSETSATFWRMCRIASLVGLAPKAWQTPYEYSSMLSQQLPQRTTLLWQLTELFVRERWGSPHHIPNQHEEEHIERLWPAFRTTLLRHFIRRIKK